MGISTKLCSHVLLIGRFGGEEQHEENRVHLGNAIMSFYSALIDLLGRCAPEMHVSTTAFRNIDFSLALAQVGDPRRLLYAHVCS